MSLMIDDTPDEHGRMSIRGAELLQGFLKIIILTNGAPLTTAKITYGDLEDKACVIIWDRPYSADFIT